MAITVHQSASSLAPAAATSHAVSFSGTPTTGRLCVVLFRWGNGFHANVTEVNVSDNQGNTYTRRAGQDWTDKGSRIYTAPIATASGTYTVTLTFTDAPEWATGSVDVTIAEISGHDTGDLIDASGAATGTGTTASIALATMQSDTVVFTVARHAYDVTPSGYSGWTALSAATDSGFATLYREGDYDPSVDFGISEWWLMSAIGINASGGAASAPKRSLLLGIG